MQDSLQNEKWRVLLDSSNKFIQLAGQRTHEQDYLEAVSILKEALTYLSPQLFEGSPSDIMTRMWQMNIQAYLMIAAILVKLEKYELSSPYIEQVLSNDPANAHALALKQIVEDKQATLSKKVT